MRERHGVEVRSEEELSIESGSVEVLEEGSGSRMDGSSKGLGESWLVEGTFLMNFPNASRGGSLGCLGIRLVTRGDREVEEVGVRKKGDNPLNSASLGQPGECAQKCMRE